MRNSLFTLAGCAALALFAVGCAGPEQKLGRGVSNSFEIVRMGEMRHSVEQANLFESPNVAYTTGVIHGLNRSLARTGLGLWEIATFPIPNHGSSYGPIATRYFSGSPIYPDSYAPKWIGGDSTMETDMSLGMSGGDVAPMIPGSRFRIFDN
jgi:putative exosortase-associated protein (TIGR04073 family)